MSRGMCSVVCSKISGLSNATQKNTPHIPYIIEAICESTVHALFVFQHADNALSVNKPDKIEDATLS